MPLFRRGRPSQSAAEALDSAEDALEADDPRSAAQHAEVAAAAARAEGDPELLGAALVIQSTALAELDSFARAEKAAAEACRATPDDPAAWYERAHACYRLARFDEAVAHAGRAVELDAEDADAWHLLGRALLWEGERRPADEALARAAALDPEEYVRPVRIASGEFDRIAAEVWRAIPAQFRARMGNTLVVAQELPDEDDVAGGFDPDTLGVYEGGTAFHDDMPERIVIFQRNHETVCTTLGDLREEVRRTVLHEVGHHFGMEEGDLPY